MPPGTPRCQHRSHQGRHISVLHAGEESASGQAVLPGLQELAGHAGQSVRMQCFMQYMYVIVMVQWNLSIVDTTHCMGQEILQRLIKSILLGYVHVHILYIHMYMYMYTYTCAHYTHTHTHIHTHIHIHIHIHTLTHTHTYTYTYTNAYVRTYAHTHTHTVECLLAHSNARRPPVHSQPPAPLSARRGQVELHLPTGHVSAPYRVPDTGPVP